MKPAGPRPGKTRVSCVRTRAHMYMRARTHTRLEPSQGILTPCLRSPLAIFLPLMPLATNRPSVFLPTLLSKGDFSLKTLVSL